MNTKYLKLLPLVILPLLAACSILSTPVPPTETPVPTETPEPTSTPTPTPIPITEVELPVKGEIGTAVGSLTWGATLTVSGDAVVVSDVNVKWKPSDYTFLPPRIEAAKVPIVDDQFEIVLLTPWQDKTGYLYDDRIIITGTFTSPTTIEGQSELDNRLLMSFDGEWSATDPDLAVVR